MNNFIEDRSVILCYQVQKKEIFSWSPVVGSPSKIPFGALKRVVEISPSRNIITYCLFHGWFALTLSAR